MATKSLQSEPVWKSGLNYLSAWFCPFAQRTWITLEAKGVPYILHEVALKNTSTGQWFQIDEKPEWWLRLNPLGKVPVLVVKDDGGKVQSVYESNICNEFLEDWHKATPLLPEDPVARARARMLIDRFSSKYVPTFYSFLVRQDKQQQAECAKKLRAEAAWLEGEAHLSGPFFMGSDFSLVDAALAPWFLRQHILEHYRGFSLPRDTPRLHKWMDVIAAHPAVKATQTHPEGDEKYPEELLNHYSKYADNTAKSTSAHDFK
jgi:glutathione S-transferase